MLYYLPLENIDMRYTTHLDRDFRNYLSKFMVGNYHIIEADISNTNEIVTGSFLDAGLTIRSKSKQIYALAKLYESGIIKDNDVVFTTDLWFPGIESIAYLNYFYNKKVKLKGVIHAGSFTDTDFVRDMERWAKNFEDMIFDISDTIFVASNFISFDILKKRMIQPNKIIVSGLPLDFITMDKYKKDNKKEDIIVFNGRNVDEKQPWLFDQLKEIMPQYVYVNTHKLKLSKESYYNLLSKSKVVVSFALQENFGYGIQEAVYLGCIPILPDRLVYKEQFSNTYRYKTFLDCIEKIQSAMNGDIISPIKKINNNNEIFNLWTS
jgi:hypothetical protein